jgi:hypothetical protein
LGAERERRESKTAARMQVRSNGAERANRRTRGAVVEEESGENRTGREDDERVGAEWGGKGSVFARFDSGIGGSESADILSFADVCLGCPPTPPEFSLASTVSVFGVSLGIWRP